MRLEFEDAGELTLDDGREVRERLDAQQLLVDDLNVLHRARSRPATTAAASQCCHSRNVNVTVPYGTCIVLTSILEYEQPHENILPLGHHGKTSKACKHV